MKCGGPNRHEPPLQQAYGLLFARRSAGIGGFRLFVELVLFEHLAIGLDARDLPRARRDRRAGPALLARILIDPR